MKKYLIILLSLGLTLQIYAANINQEKATDTMKIKTENSSSVTDSTVLKTPSDFLDEKSWSFGIGWPVLMARYSFSNNIDAEFRFAYGDSIFVYALRGYWKYLKFPYLRTTVGLETGLIYFDTTKYGFKGNGYEFEPFAGLEVPIWNYLSVVADIGPSFIILTSGSTTETTMEWIINAGIYYRFF